MKQFLKHVYESYNEYLFMTGFRFVRFSLLDWPYIAYWNTHQNKGLLHMTNDKFGDSIVSNFDNASFS